MRTAILSATAALLLASAAQAGGHFKRINVHGALDVYPAAINSSGDISGYFDTGKGHDTGFLRSSSGAVTKFAIGTDGTHPSDINDDDLVTGILFDPQGHGHGFVRAPDGATTVFDVPHGTGTNPVAINASGVIAGAYIKGRLRGFIRTADGNIVKFQPPGRPETAGANAINDAGMVAGSYLNRNESAHDYLRAADGTITVLDVPGAQAGTLSVNGLTADGTIAGTYSDAQNLAHGYLLAPNGTVTVIDIPGADKGTDLIGASPNGFVTGFYDDSAFVQHGFLRDPEGTITTFDPPGALSTTPIAVNASGEVTGWYNDGMGDHGFLRTP